MLPGFLVQLKILVGVPFEIRRFHTGWDPFTGVITIFSAGKAVCDDPLLETEDLMVGKFRPELTCSACARHLLAK